MFHTLLLLFTIQISHSAESIYCKQKEVPKDVLSSLSYSIPNLQTDTLKIQNSNLNLHYTTFNVTLVANISSNYSVSLSVQNIHSYSPKNSIDFQVTAMRSPSWFTGCLIMDREAQWGWVSVSYVVSGRSDFRVGNFIAANNLLVSPTSNNTDVPISYILPLSQKVEGSYLYAVPFVSGMRTFDFELSFRFTSSQFNASTNELKLSVHTIYKTYPLELLSVSYLVFSMASDLQITSVYNIYFIPSSVSNFLGVSAVNSTPALFNRVDANATKPLLEASPTQLQAFEEMFGIDGIIVQTQQSVDVLYLPVQDVSTTLSCISKTTCSDYGGFMVYEQVNIYQISSHCKICPKNSIFNYSLNSCQCLSGYTAANDSCIKTSLTCKINEVYDEKSQKCLCGPLFVNVSGKCTSIFSVCPVNQIYFQGKCIQVVINRNAGLCPDGYLMINQQCEKKKNCSSPQILKESTNQCVCPASTYLAGSVCRACTVNETVVNEACVCRDGFFSIQNSCLKCSQNAYFNGSKCVCLRLYEGDGFTCTALSSNLQTKLASEAPSGFYLSGGIISLESGQG